MLGGKQITGWKDFALSLAYLPVLTPPIALFVTAVLYYERTIEPVAKRAILRLFRRR